MSCGRTAQTYTGYITDNMYRPHCSNAAAHTPCVCDTPMCAVLLGLVVFVGVFHRLPVFFHTDVFAQADVYPCTTFCVVARSTDHRPDNNRNNPQSVFTFSFLKHHNPAAQHQQQWAHLPHIDDGTARVAVCVPTLPLLHLGSAHCANSRSRQVLDAHVEDPRCTFNTI